MNKNPVVPRNPMESTTHRSIKIFSGQVNILQKLLDYAHPDAEIHILRKYGVRELDELWALDYENIKQDINKFMGKR